MALREAIEWRYETLRNNVWKQLGPQKFLAGRRVMNKAFAEAIAIWPTTDGLMPHLRDGTLSYLKQTVSEKFEDYDGRKVRYGFVWTIILSALVGQLIRLLLEWWLKSDSNRQSMTYMQHAIRNGGLQ